MAKRRTKTHPGLTKEQQQLVQEHKWVAGRLAYGAVSSTGGHTGSLTKEDLEAVANFALCVAASRYDDSLGIMFSTYAWKTARGYIQHALRDYSRLVRTPRWVVKYKKEVDEGLKNNLSYSEIAENLGIPESKVLITEMSSMNFHLSYDSSPEDWTSREFIFNDDDVKPYVVSEELLADMRELTDAEMAMLIKYIDGTEMPEEEREWAADKFHSLKGTAYGNCSEFIS
jgi:DNA-directed RNA polymerase specialized sigma subunit